MTAWLVFISTCVFETALCIYYYDSFIFFKWGKIQKLISFILLALSVGGNSALFEMHIAAYVGRFCGAKRPRCVASGHSF